MEQVFFVENGDLYEVNKWLQKGGRIKSIHAVAENVSSFGFAGGESSNSDWNSYTGNVYAYVVIEFD